MSKATLKSDFTKGAECVKYAFEKMEDIKQKPDQMVFNPYLIDYLQQIMQALASVDAKRRLDLIVPESVKPNHLRHAVHSRILESEEVVQGVIYFI